MKFTFVSELPVFFGLSRLSAFVPRSFSTPSAEICRSAPWESADWDEPTITAALDDSTYNFYQFVGLQMPGMTMSSSYLDVHYIRKDSITAAMRIFNLIG